LPVGAAAMHERGSVGSRFSVAMWRGIEGRCYAWWKGT